MYRSGDVLLRVGAGDPAPQIVLLAHLKACSLDVLTPLDLARLQVGTWWVTAWPWLDSAAGVAIDGERLGRTVARLHQLGAPALGMTSSLPEYRSFPWLDLQNSLSTIAPSGAVTPTQLKVLIREADALANWWIEATPYGVVTCHGDVHPNNVLVTASRQFLLDWDSICLGPPQLDHATLLTWETRWGGQPGLYSAFARGYGHDFSNDPVTVLLGRFRNLVATINMVVRSIADASVRAESQIRLRWWTGERNAPQWTPQ